MRIMEEYIIYAEGVKREIQDKFDTLMKKCTRNYKSGALKEGGRERMYKKKKRDKC